MKENRVSRLECEREHEELLRDAIKYVKTCNPALIVSMETLLATQENTFYAKVITDETFKVLRMIEKARDAQENLLRMVKE